MQERRRMRTTQTIPACKEENRHETEGWENKIRMRTTKTIPGKEETRWGKEEKR